jgi:hypothetical protein
MPIITSECTEARPLVHFGLDLPLAVLRQDEASLSGFTNSAPGRPAVRAFCKDRSIGGIPSDIFNSERQYAIVGHRNGWRHRALPEFAPAGLSFLVSRVRKRPNASSLKLCGYSRCVLSTRNPPSVKAGWPMSAAHGGRKRC